VHSSALPLLEGFGIVQPHLKENGTSHFSWLEVTGGVGSFSCAGGISVRTRGQARKKKAEKSYENGKAGC